MRIWYTAILCIFLSTISFGQNQLTYSRVKINLQNHHIKDVARLGLEVDHGMYKAGHFIINDYSQAEVEILRNAGMDFEILIPNASTFYAQRARKCLHDHKGDLRSAARPANCETVAGKFDYNTPENYQFGDMGGYLTYAEAIANLDSMHTLYPHLITPKMAIDTFKTHNGLPIYHFIISDNPGDTLEPQVIYTSLHHAREPNSLAQNLFFMWYLLENYDSNEEIKFLVDHTQLYFVPIVNPDGYIINEVNNPNGGGLWRKNAYKNESGEEVGVDLNRNYGFHWGFDDIGSSPVETSQTYRGPSAFSEPETQAIKWLSEQNRFQLALNYHTYGNLLIHPWGFNDEITDEDDIFKGIGELMIRDNRYTMGTGTETVGYTVNGDSDDYMYGDTTNKNKIYSYTPEVGSQSDGFWPSPDRIDYLNKINVHQNMTLARVVHNFATVEVDYPEMLVAEQSGDINIYLQRFGFKDAPTRLQVSAITPDLELDAYDQELSLEHLSIDTLTLPFSLQGMESSYLFEVAHTYGSYTQLDTFEIKVSEDSQQDTLFATDLNDLEHITTSDWELTDKTFVSPSTCLTDSPDVFYDNDLSSSFEIDSVFDFSNAASAEFTFMARWAIEDDYDYVMVQASTDGGAEWMNLCGQYTSFGSIYQPEGEPLYDGRQSEWVRESMDVQDLLGEEAVQFRFLLVTDQGVADDGYYVDDLLIISENGMSTASAETAIIEGALLSPNPTSGRVYSIGGRSVSDVQIFSATGERLIYLRGQQSSFDISALPAGIYVARYQDSAGQLYVQRLVKQ